MTYAATCLSTLASPDESNACFQYFGMYHYMRTESSMLLTILLHLPAPIGTYHVCIVRVWRMMCCYSNGRGGVNSHRLSPCGRGRVPRGQSAGSTIRQQSHRDADDRFGPHASAARRHASRGDVPPVKSSLGTTIGTMCGSSWLAGGGHTHHHRSRACALHLREAVSDAPVTM